MVWQSHGQTSVDDGDDVTRQLFGAKYLSSNLFHRTQQAAARLLLLLPTSTVYTAQPYVTQTMVYATLSSASSVWSDARSTTVKSAHDFEVTCPVPLSKGNAKNLNLPAQLTPINRRRRVTIEVHEVGNNKLCTRAIVSLLLFVTVFQLTSLPT